MGTNTDNKNFLERYKFTYAIGYLLQNISLAPLIFTNVALYYYDQKDNNNKAFSYAISGKILNVLLCSIAPVIGFTKLYHLEKINLVAAISLSFAFPLTWLISGGIGYAVVRSNKVDLEAESLYELESFCSILTYCNQLFMPLLAITVPTDLAIDKIQERYSSNNRM